MIRILTLAMWLAAISNPAIADGGGCVADGIKIDCDGPVIADFAGQNIIYSGHTEFECEGLRVAVDGQVQLFLGVSLKRLANGVRSRVEIQSITANGKVVLVWQGKSKPETLRGTRLTVSAPDLPSNPLRITLGGRVDPVGKAIPGAALWKPQLKSWQEFENSSKRAAAPRGEHHDGSDS